MCSCRYDYTSATFMCAWEYIIYIITQPGQAGCGQILLHLLTEQRTSGRPSQPPRISHNVVRARECATKTIALCKYTHTHTHSQAGRRRSKRALFESEFLIVRATWCAPQIALIKSPINYAHQRPFSVAGFEHERLSSIMHRARCQPLFMQNERTLGAGGFN